MPLNRIGIPRIVGDIIAGCLLGPTVLQDGVFTPFPVANRGVIYIVGYIGLIFASLSSGSNFDRRILRGRYFKVFLFSTVNIFATFGSMWGLAELLPNSSDWRGPGYTFLSFGFYFGAVSNINPSAVHSNSLIYVAATLILTGQSSRVYK